MVLDNARIHHAKLLQSFIDQNAEKLELLFLPHIALNSTLWKGYGDG